MEGHSNTGRDILGDGKDRAVALGHAAEIAGMERDGSDGLEMGGLQQGCTGVRQCTGDSRDATMASGLHREDAAETTGMQRRKAADTAGMCWGTQQRRRGCTEGCSRDSTDALSDARECSRVAALGLPQGPQRS